MVSLKMAQEGMDKIQEDMDKTQHHFSKMQALEVGDSLTADQFFSLD